MSGSILGFAQGTMPIGVILHRPGGTLIPFRPVFLFQKRVGGFQWKCSTAPVRRTRCAGVASRAPPASGASPAARARSRPSNRAVRRFGARCRDHGEAWQAWFRRTARCAERLSSQRTVITLSVRAVSLGTGNSESASEEVSRLSDSNHCQEARFQTAGRIGPR
jgi:hypothetical protein